MANKTDQIAILNLIREALPTTFNETIKLLQDPSIFCYRTYDCGLLMAFALIKHYQTHAELLLIYVSQVARRSGYGSMLLKYIKSKYKEIHINMSQYLYYLVEFYEKNGFVFQCAVGTNCGPIIKMIYLC